MKRNRLTPLSLAIIVLGVLTLASCKKDEDKAPPVASFTTSIDDKTVTFTNTSEGATSYQWSFDDDSEISEETNPVHTYEAYGDYDVRLTATGEGGEVVEKQTISVIKNWPDIVIDGNFSDWDEVETFYGGYGDASGTLIEAKVTSDASLANLYFYVEGIFVDTVPTLQILFNVDADTATGWVFPHGLLGNGVEYLLEFKPFDMDWTGIYPVDAEKTAEGWPWAAAVATSTDAVPSFELGGTTKVEFVIPVAKFTNPPMDAEIGIYFWMQNNAWTTVGAFPPEYAEPLYVQNTFSFQ